MQLNIPSFPNPDAQLNDKVLATASGRGAGVASAFGFLAAPTAFFFVRGRVEALDQLDAQAATRLLGELES